MNTEKSTWLDHLPIVDEYSVYSVAVSHVSKMIAYELFYQGSFNLINFKVEDEYSLDNQKFVQALSPHVQRIEKAIVDSIEKGEIKTTFKMRDLESGMLDSTNTLINQEEAYKFLEIYGISDIGEEGYPFHDYMEAEMNLLDSILGTIEFHKKYYGNGQEYDVDKEVDELYENKDDIAELVIENINLNREIKSLKIQTQPQAEKPISTRERNTLLTIIAALTNDAKIDIFKTSKSGELISRMTQQLGALVDGETIASKLKQIPDALERRSK